MLPDASTTSLMQLPLPLAVPAARPQPPPLAEITTKPEQVWRSVSPEVQARIRQTWLGVLGEVTDDRHES